MSVRRNPARVARRGTTDFWGVAKGTLFWGSLLAGSFLFGMLVISPIYYQWRGGPSASANGSITPQNQPPSIQAPAATQTHEDSRERARPTRRVPEPEVSVTAEPDSSQVQTPDSPDESRSARRRSGEDRNGLTTADPGVDQTPAERSRTAPQEDLIQTEQGTRPDTQRVQEPDSPQPSETRRARRARRSAETNKEETAATKRRSRKPAGDEASGEGKRKESGGKSDVQKGETID
jgi:hypothetical protein